MHYLGHLARWLQLRREIEQMAPLARSRSAPKALSTKVMISGLLGSTLGLLLASPHAMIASAAAFLAGLLLALVEALMEVWRDRR